MTVEEIKKQLTDGYQHAINQQKFWAEGVVEARSKLEFLLQLEQNFDINLKLPAVAEQEAPKAEPEPEAEPEQEAEAVPVAMQE